jgi:hypothetical protein
MSRVSDIPVTIEDFYQKSATSPQTEDFYRLLSNLALIKNEEFIMLYSAEVIVAGQ